MILFTFTDANPTEFLLLINCLRSHFGPENVLPLAELQKHEIGSN